MFSAIKKMAVYRDNLLVLLCIMKEVLNKIGLLLMEIYLYMKLYHVKLNR